MEAALKKISRLCYAGLTWVLAWAMLVGCKSGPSTPAVTSQSVEDTYTSKTLTASYTGALNASSQLMLGMLRLEGTDDAITSEQAKALLPVLQSLQGQSLKAEAERNAVWANVEVQLTSAQIKAIANMHLTQDDLQSWMRDNSQAAGPMPGGVGPQGTPGAGPGQGGPRPQGTPGAGPGQGGPRPQGTPGAPPSSGGPASGAGFGTGQGNFLMSGVIRLLMQKAGGGATPPPGPASTTLPLPAPTKP